MSASAKKTLPCPRCMEECFIQVDVSDGESCQCCGCGEEFPVTFIRRLHADWIPFLAWLDDHPAKRPPPEANKKV